MRVITLMPPRILSVLLNQLLTTINTSLAILISTSSVVILKFGGQLQYFPVHLFGASMAAAALPVLSKHANPDGMEKFKKIFVTTLHQMLFLVMPISIILLILRVPIVRLVYGVSNFTWQDTVLTSYTLGFFSISIFAQGIIFLVSRSFYALKDTLTPVIISAITIIANVLVSVLFVTFFKLGVWSIAFAFSITSILEMLLLFYMLQRKVGGFEIGNVLVPFIKIGYASLFMGVSLYVPMKMLDVAVFDTTRTINLLALFIITSGAGLCSYLFFTHLFNVEEVDLIYKLLSKLNFKVAKDSLSATIISDRQE